MNTQYKWLILLLIFGCISCDSDDDASTTMQEVVITSGDADFSTYVSLGNSLTAGFTDGALFIAGQENSMSNILANQFALAGGGDFTQPLMSDNIGGALIGGMPALNPRFYFYSDPNPEPPNESGPRLLGTTPGDNTPEIPTTEITNVLSGPFNNMGIPGAKSFHLLADGYGNAAGLPSLANPYFVRIASSATASVLGDAMAQNPTFFSLWIGNNDVLGYALSGGDGTDPITDQTMFTNAYNGLVTTLTSGGAKGVAFNIPNVTSIPHFTTVPFKPLDPTNPGFGPLIPTLNAQFAGLNEVFTGLGVPERAIEFALDAASAVVIKDESLPDLSSQITAALIANMVDPGTATLTGILYGQARPANENDLLVLPSSSIIGQVNTDAVAMLMMTYGLSQMQAGQLAVNGVTFPLEDKWVLIPAEQQEIAAATTAFNTVISSAVQQAGLAFVDANMILDQISESENGIAFDEFLLNDNLVFGGAFSLDGVHPTARGYAFLANKAIEEINTTYNSNLPLVKAVDYPTFYSLAMLQ
ncbi:SGNH/GDSL hydrolase family protein [Aquimarina algiphila]|uniref:G-D-S-L family lipolytic protein n=1 Tax=Aquimarina algiphila TaxID=2047982 RepID=UPI00232D7FCE|nr:G-D-S-L family lipolytic protein [Aquimarina algiphila]